MNALYHLIRADLLERTRRYSFLIMLGLVLYLGYLVNIGQITLRLDTYRGLFNSAWVGSMMTLVVNFVLGWFGFYLVKNSIARDYETGVGQIMATTPLSRMKYLIGKWLSNFLVLDGMVCILMLAAIVMQLIEREDPQIHLWALIAPFLFVALPFMALIAAFAVLFESIGWLRGSIGNIVYFFFFIGGLTFIAIMFGVNIPMLDWLGFGIFKSSMAVAAKAMYPAYQGGLSLSFVPATGNIQPFTWSGVDWTLPVIATRMTLIIGGLGIVILSALFFDRFDSMRIKASSRQKPDLDTPEVAPATEHTLPAKIQLHPLTQSRMNSRFGTLFLAELRMQLKGQPWWWYLLMLGLIMGSFIAPLDSIRTTILPAALIAPLLLWSGLGNREARFNTQQMVFYTPNPLWNQLAATWLTGLMVTSLTVAGCAFKFLLAGETTSLLSLFAGIIFIPSLALALGTWTGGSKAFEVIYVLFWYLGLLNKVSELDFIGLHSSTYWLIYLLLGFILLAFAVFGRQRQLQG